MDAKLTLRLDREVIERAKAYAHDHQVSLSKMIESYLDALTQPQDDIEKPKITPLVESLIGVISLPENYDYKKDYIDHLEKKYK